MGVGKSGFGDGTFVFGYVLPFFKGGNDGGVVRKATEVQGTGVGNGRGVDLVEGEKTGGEGREGSVVDRSAVVGGAEMGRGGLGKFGKFPKNEVPGLPAVA